MLVENGSFSEPLDLLIVVGKNIGVCSSPDDMRADKYHLSRESRLSTLAARLVCQDGMTIVFSGGHAAGEDMPSEAEAMRDYFLSRLRTNGFNPERIITEEKSKNTVDNATEVVKLLGGDLSRYKRIGLLSIGAHSDNAAIIFDHHGIRIDQVIRAEDVLRESPGLYDDYLKRRQHTPRGYLEQAKEGVRTFLLHTFDRKANGKLLGFITQYTRG